MRKALVGFALLVSLIVGTVGVTALPAGAAITCVHSTQWFRQHPASIGGPDMSASLEAAILAKIGQASLADVLSAPWASLDVVAAKPLIAAASNGSNGDHGFTGTLGNAFYKLAHYYEGTETLSKFQVALYAVTLEVYNAGFLGVPSCSWHA